MTMSENQVQPDPTVAAAPRTTGTPPVTPSSPPQSEPSLGSAVHSTGSSLRDIAETTKDETATVAREAGDHAQELWRQTREELTEQAAAQQDRAARGLRSLGEELHAMSQSSEQHGVAADLAQQGADLATRVAAWLEERRPGDIAGEVTRFARRKPGTFLLVATAVGVVGGRLTRGMGGPDDGSDDVTDLRERRTASGSQPATGGLMAPIGPDAEAWSDGPTSPPEGTGFTESSPSAPPLAGADPRYVGGMP